MPPAGQVQSAVPSTCTVLRHLIVNSLLVGCSKHVCMCVFRLISKVN